MTWSPVQAETDHSNLPFYQGEPKILQSQTLLQDAGRVAALLPNTVMAQIASSRKWVPLADCDPVATPGYLTCGAFGTTAALLATVTDGSFKVQIDGETAIHATGLNFSKIDSLASTSATLLCGTNGTNLAGWEAVTNGGFAITVDGTLHTILDVDFDNITELEDVAIRINSHTTMLGVTCSYDKAANKYRFTSKTRGATSTITVLSAGGTTDISGAGFLNGLTGVGTVTAGTGLDGSEIPAGIYRGASIAAATLVAGDVTGNEIVVGGPCMFDATNVVFDSTGSVTMNTVIPTMRMTVARALELRGLYGTDTAAADANV